MSLLVTLVGHVAVNSCGSMYLIQGMTIKNYVKVTKIAGDDTYSPQIAVADGIMTVVFEFLYTLKSTSPSVNVR